MTTAKRRANSGATIVADNHYSQSNQQQQQQLQQLHQHSINYQEQQRQQPHHGLSQQTYQQQYQPIQPPQAQQQQQPQIITDHSQQQQHNYQQMSSNQNYRNSGTNETSLLSSSTTSSSSSSPPSTVRNECSVKLPLDILLKKFTEIEMFANTNTFYQNWGASCYGHLSANNRQDAFSCGGPKLIVDSNAIETIMKLDAVLSKVKNENQELKTYNNYLQRDSEWLRGELFEREKQLQTMQSRMAALEDEINYMKFKGAMGNAKNSSFINEKPVEEEIQTSFTENLKKPNSPKERRSSLNLLFNLAVQYTLQGKYEIAVPVCKEALNAFKDTNNEHHVGAATILNFLSIICTEYGLYWEAARYLEKSLLIRTFNCGFTDESAIITLDNLATLYVKCQWYRKAEEAKLKLMRIRQQMLGDNHLELAEHLSDLATLCHQQGRCEEEQIYYHRVVNIYESQLDANDIRVKRAKLNLANCLIDQRKLQEAALLYEQIEGVF
uniref:Kinesin light chain n=1 Tax=Glossina pallidipes TaxID=7398 RepID=A0A1B0AFQ2_GLOPL